MAAAGPADAQLGERLWHAAATGDLRGAADAILSGARIDFKAMYKAVSPDANPWNPSGGRLTPLSVAAYHGHAEMVRLLLQHGADPTVRNDWGHPILQFCKGSDVSLLIEAALRERRPGKDDALYLSPKALPSSPPNVLVTDADQPALSPRRGVLATSNNGGPGAGGNLSPSPHNARAASPSPSGAPSLSGRDRRHGSAHTVAPCAVCVGCTTSAPSVCRGEGQRLPDPPQGARRLCGRR